MACAVWGSRGLRFESCHPDLKYKSRRAINISHLPAWGRAAQKLNAKRYIPFCAPDKESLMPRRLRTSPAVPEMKDRVAEFRAICIRRPHLFLPSLEYGKTADVGKIETKWLD